MFDIALTVAACLRAGTRAEVAWLVGTDGIPVGDWSDALVLTPGGGKIGSLAGGALDGRLADSFGRSSVGRLLQIEVGETDALIAGLPSGGSARCLLVPAEVLPAGLWDLALERESFCLVCVMTGDEVADFALYTADTVSAAGDPVASAFTADGSGSTMAGDLIVSVFRALPRLVIVGDTPVVAALAGLADVVGWQTRVATDAGSATGLIAGLSSRDKLVVAAHELELAGAALMAGLESGAGYIGALGGRRMQENRADWLAYRGVTDISRVHGPAGIDIGAETPAEIAVSILAEAIAEDAG
ncbi:MAG TPA: XdhC family protein [Acidimicrobiia bacterium]